MPSLGEQIALLRTTISRDFAAMLREPGGALAHPFIVPGSAQYLDQLWDWDSWLTNIALRQIAAESTDPAASAAHLAPYERGCILNFLSTTGWHGWSPIMFPRSGAPRPADPYAENMHKPCLVQHAAFLVREAGGDAEWLREHAFGLHAFLNNYRGHHRHAATGLYFWQNDLAIGVDNDPCTYGRPPRSSASIYLNCLMYRELLAAEYISARLGQPEVAAAYARDAAHLLAAVREHCWDEWTGSYYSVDLNVGPHHSSHAPRDDGLPLHAGLAMDWSCLIQRVGVWSNFLALWSGIATPAQAARMAREHLADPRTFNAPAGVRTLSKMEKMYSIRASGNPSSWLGPVWGVANYLTFRGLVRHGLDAEARELCDKTIALFARDVERFGALHEYYEPETGEPLLNRGFQNWNCLVLNMAAWREGRPFVTEF
jgi:putative isomerase